ncbi:MAG: PQQ-dependent sugar dehydrogenase [Gemmatimonadetes bacterium]|nr:PQQ-dependent sugar dehydrogenase [Gemmatimonadota bacterium]
MPAEFRADFDRFWGLGDRLSTPAGSTRSGETRETLFALGAQVRDVREGPDGLLYFVTNEENGRLMRIEPAE